MRLALVALLAVSCAHVQRELPREETQALPGSGAGVSLANDWTLDLVEAQPTQQFFTKQQSDARYCRLIGCTMTGTLTGPAFTGTGVTAFNLSASNGRITWTAAGRYIDVNEGTGTLRFSSLNLAPTGDVFIGGSDLEGSATNQSFFVTTLVDDATVTPTQPAFVFGATTNLTAGDALAGWGHNGDTAGSNFRITTYGAQDAVARNATPTAATGVAAVYNGQILHKVSSVTITEAALTAAAGTEDETPWSTLPTKARLLRLSGHVSAAFAGPSITDVKLMCGPTAGTNTYLISQDVDVLNAALGDVAADIGASLTAATVADIPSMTATSAVVCRFTCTGANCSVMTAGSVTLYLEYLVYP